MSRFYGFQLSPNIDLSGRVLTIKDVGQDPPVTLKTFNLAGATLIAECELPDNRMCEAVLVDTRDSRDLPPTRLKFSTWEGNEYGKSGSIEIVSSEEASSSSSTSSLSSSSSSSTSSLSSSSSSTSTLSSSSSSRSSQSSSSTSSLSSLSSSSS